MRKIDITACSSTANSGQEQAVVSAVPAPSSTLKRPQAPKLPPKKTRTREWMESISRSMFADPRSPAPTDGFNKEFIDFIQSPRVPDRFDEEEDEEEAIKFWICDPEVYEKEQERRNMLKIKRKSTRNIPSVAVSNSLQSTAQYPSRTDSRAQTTVPSFSTQGDCGSNKLSSSIVRGSDQSKGKGSCANIPHHSIVPVAKLLRNRRVQAGTLKARIEHQVTLKQANVEEAHIPEIVSCHAIESEPPNGVLNTSEVTSPQASGNVSHSENLNYLKKKLGCKTNKPRTKVIPPTRGLGKHGKILNRTESAVTYGESIGKSSAKAKVFADWQSADLSMVRAPLKFRSSSWSGYPSKNNDVNNYSETHKFKASKPKKARKNAKVQKRHPESGHQGKASSSPSLEAWFTSRRTTSLDMQMLDNIPISRNPPPANKSPVASPSSASKPVVMTLENERKPIHETSKAQNTSNAEDMIVYSKDIQIRRPSFRSVGVQSLSTATHTCGLCERPTSSLTFSSVASDPSQTKAISLCSNASSRLVEIQGSFRTPSPSQILTYRHSTTISHTDASYEKKLAILPKDTRLEKPPDFSSSRRPSVVTRFDEPLDYSVKTLRSIEKGSKTHENEQEFALDLSRKKKELSRNASKIAPETWNDSTLGEKVAKNPSAFSLAEPSREAVKVCVQARTTVVQDSTDVHGMTTVSFSSLMSKTVDAKQDNIESIELVEKVRGQAITKLEPTKSSADDASAESNLKRSNGSATSIGRDGGRKPENYFRSPEPKVGSYLDIIGKGQPEANSAHTVANIDTMHHGQMISTICQTSGGNLASNETVFHLQSEGLFAEGPADVQLCIASGSVNTSKQLNNEIFVKKTPSAMVDTDFEDTRMKNIDVRNLLLDSQQQSDFTITTGVKCFEDASVFSTRLSSKRDNCLDSSPQFETNDSCVTEHPKESVINVGDCDLVIDELYMKDNPEETASLGASPEKQSKRGGNQHPSGKSVQETKEILMVQGELKSNEFPDLHEQVDSSSNGEAERKLPSKDRHSVLNGAIQEGDDGATNSDVTMNDTVTEFIENKGVSSDTLKETVVSGTKSSSAKEFHHASKKAGQDDITVNFCTVLKNAGFVEKEKINSETLNEDDAVEKKSTAVKDHDNLKDAKQKKNDSGINTDTILVGIGAVSKRYDTATEKENQPEVVAEETRKHLVGAIPFLSAKKKWLLRIKISENMKNYKAKFDVVNEIESLLEATVAAVGATSVGEVSSKACNECASSTVNLIRFEERKPKPDTVHENEHQRDFKTDDIPDPISGKDCTTGAKENSQILGSVEGCTENVCTLSENKYQPEATVDDIIVPEALDMAGKKNCFLDGITEGRNSPNVTPQISSSDEIWPDSPVTSDDEIVYVTPESLQTTMKAKLAREKVPNIQNNKGNDGNSVERAAQQERHKHKFHCGSLGEKTIVSEFMDRGQSPSISEGTGTGESKKHVVACSNVAPQNSHDMQAAEKVKVGNNSLNDNRSTERCEERNSDSDKSEEVASESNTVESTEPERLQYLHENPSNISFSTKIQQSLLHGGHEVTNDKVSELGKSESDGIRFSPLVTTERQEKITEDMTSISAKLAQSTEVEKQMVEEGQKMRNKELPAFDNCKEVDETNISLTEVAAVAEDAEVAAAEFREVQAPSNPFRENEVIHEVTGKTGKSNAEISPSMSLHQGQDISCDTDRELDKNMDAFSDSDELFHGMRTPPRNTFIDRKTSSDNQDFVEGNEACCDEYDNMFLTADEDEEEMVEMSQNKENLKNDSSSLDSTQKDVEKLLLQKEKERSNEDTAPEMSNAAENITVDCDGTNNFGNVETKIKISVNKVNGGDGNAITTSPADSEQIAKFSGGEEPESVSLVTDDNSVVQLQEVKETERKKRKTTRTRNYQRYAAHSITNKKQSILHPQPETLSMPVSNPVSSSSIFDTNSVTNPVKRKTHLKLGYNTQIDLSACDIKIKRRKLVTRDDNFLGPKAPKISSSKKSSYILLSDSSDSSEESDRFFKINRTKRRLKRSTQMSPPNTAISRKMARINIPTPTMPSIQEESIEQVSHDDSVLQVNKRHEFSECSQQTISTVSDSEKYSVLHTLEIKRNVHHQTAGTDKFSDPTLKTGESTQNLVMARSFSKLPRSDTSEITPSCNDFTSENKTAISSQNSHPLSQFSSVSSVIYASPCSDHSHESEVEVQYGITMSCHPPSLNHTRSEFHVSNFQSGCSSTSDDSEKATPKVIRLNAYVRDPSASDNEEFYQTFTPDSFQASKPRPSTPNPFKSIRRRKTQNKIRPEAFSSKVHVARVSFPKAMKTIDTRHIKPTCVRPAPSPAGESRQNSIPVALEALSSDSTGYKLCTKDVAKPIIQLCPTQKLNSSNGHEAGSRHAATNMSSSEAGKTAKFRESFAAKASQAVFHPALSKRKSPFQKRTARIKGQWKRTKMRTLTKISVKPLISHEPDRLSRPERDEVICLVMQKLFEMGLIKDSMPNNEIPGPECKRSCDIIEPESHPQGARMHASEESTTSTQPFNKPVNQGSKSKRKLAWSTTNDVAVKPCLVAIKRLNIAK